MEDTLPCSLHQPVSRRLEPSRPVVPTLTSGETPGMRPACFLCSRQSQACSFPSHTHVPSGEVSAIWISLGLEMMSSSGSPLSMSFRLKMITSVPGEEVSFHSGRDSPVSPHTAWGSAGSRLLTAVPRNLHELGHHFLLCAEGRVFVDELCLDGKLLHVICDGLPGPSMPGGQWDDHLWGSTGRR